MSELEKKVRKIIEENLNPEESGESLISEIVREFSNLPEIPDSSPHSDFKEFRRLLGDSFKVEESLLAAYEWGRAFERNVAKHKLESQLTDCQERLKEAKETLEFYGNEMNYSTDDYRGLSGEMIHRCILYSDMEERNDVYSYAGKRARDTLRRISR